MKEKKKTTRHKIITLFYEDEGDGDGRMILETPQGLVCIGSVSPNGVHQFDWAQMLETEVSTLHVRTTFQTSSFTREPLVVLAEETLKKPLPP